MHSLFVDSHMDTFGCQPIKILDLMNFWQSDSDYNTWLFFKTSKTKPINKNVLEIFLLLMDEMVALLLGVLRIQTDPFDQDQPGYPDHSVKDHPLAAKRCFHMRWKLRSTWTENNKGGQTRLAPGLQDGAGCKGARKLERASDSTIPQPSGAKVAWSNQTFI